MYRRSPATAPVGREKLQRLEQTHYEQPMVSVSASPVCDGSFTYDEIPDLDNQMNETSYYLQPNVSYAPATTTFSPYQSLDKATMNKYHK